MFFVKYYFSVVINGNFEVSVILMFKIETSEANNWEKCKQRLNSLLN